jgi:hypothetical protein
MTLHYMPVSCEILITFTYFITLYNAKSWTVRGSNPRGGEIFRTRPDSPWGPPSFLYVEYLFYPRVKRKGCGFKHQPPGSAEVRE